MNDKESREGLTEAVKEFDDALALNPKNIDASALRSHIMRGEEILSGERQ
jgi:hypothetical protein